tara:strand:- start:768 stop:1007 length:240 start_codon:yes stop_codon:yes gene_type:complete
MKHPKLTVTAVERALAIRTQLNDIVNELVQDYFAAKLSRRDLEGATSIFNQPREQIANMARDLASRAVGIIEEEEQRSA